MLVLAGCNAPASDDTPTPEPWQWPDDPPTDRLGWEAGYWHNESIDVNQSDGLDRAEREAFVARTMARVEYLRGLEFEESVPVQVLTREQYRENDTFSRPYSAWDEQVWEALFLVGEDETVNATFERIYGGSVLGYYSPSNDRIVLISDGDGTVVDRETLAHELVHALQDQHYGFTSEPTLDRRLGAQGLTEGDPSLVTAQYQSRCADGNWSCVATPRMDRSGGGPINFGVYLTLYQPYSDGPAFVDALYRRDGWDAVDAAYDDRPASTEQTIHPGKYPADDPVSVSVPDRSGANWRPIGHDPATQTVGEAALYVMFRENDMIADGHLRGDDVPHSPYNYSHRRTAGWAGDALVPYESDDGEYGYVFRTEWETTDDAREFAGGYRTMLLLRLHGERVDETTVVVPDGSYADAFRIVRDGRTVTVVNAPSVDALDDVHRRD
jgi:hypothetical protein